MRLVPPAWNQHIAGLLHRLQRHCEVRQVRQTILG
jgi:hypothetical protein